MSSILKALEKVEQERNAQHEGPLGRFHKERERRRGWVLPVCVVSGAAGAALLTFAAMGGFSGHKEGKVQVAQLQPHAPAPAAPAPAAPAQKALPVEVIAPPQVRTEGAAAPKGGVVPAPAAAGNLETATRKPHPAVHAGSAVAAPRVVAKGREKKGVAASTGSRAERKKVAKVVAAPAAAPAVLRPSEAPAARPAAVQAAPQQAAAPTQAIRVTGIAWQKDGGKSVAMINGRQAYEGDTVEGSRIKEILQDRVRFSTTSGGTFDVPLGAGQ